MAFNDKELQIIQWGKQNGKTPDEIKAAVVQFRTGAMASPVAPTPTQTPETPSFASRVATDITKRGEQLATDITTPVSTPTEAIKQGTAATATAFGGIGDVVMEAIRSVPGGQKALDAIGGVTSSAFKAITDKLASSKFFQEAAAGLPANNPTENLLSTAASGGEIANNILAVDGAVKGGQATVNTARTVGSETAQMVKDAANAVTNIAVEAPSKARAWVQEPLKASVETALKETTSKRFDEYVDVARNAAKNNKNPTPLEVAGSKAQEALTTIQKDLNATGEAKSELMKFAGVSGFNGAGITEFRQGLQSFLNSKTAIEGDTKLIRDIKTEFDKLGATPSVGQVDRFVDFAQDRIYSGAADLTIPVTSETTAAIRSLVGKLNNNLKQQLSPEYRGLNEKYANLVGIRNELNMKLGKEGEKGGALMKRVFSPSDANTKKLFADVLDITGIDLVNEATLARYLMDILGDARQKSMLEQLNLQATTPTAGGITTRLIDYLVEKANSPEDLIRRARELTVGGTGATAKP